MSFFTPRKFWRSSIERENSIAKAQARYAWPILSKKRHKVATRYRSIQLFRGHIAPVSRQISHPPDRFSVFILVDFSPPSLSLSLSSLPRIYRTCNRVVARKPDFSTLRFRVFRETRNPLRHPELVPANECLMDRPRCLAFSLSLSLSLVSCPASPFTVKNRDDITVRSFIISRGAPKIAAFSALFFLPGLRSLLFPPNSFFFFFLVCTFFHFEPKVSRMDHKAGERVTCPRVT